MYQAENGTGIFSLMNGMRKNLTNGKSKLTYSERKPEIESLRETIQQLNIENLSVVDMFYEGTDQTQIWKWLDYAEEHDLEGVIVNLDAPYECKRTKNLIKVKKFYTYDLKVIGYEEGSGRLAGTLGALIVDFKSNAVNDLSVHVVSFRHTPSIARNPRSREIPRGFRWSVTVLRRRHQTCGNKRVNYRLEVCCYSGSVSRSFVNLLYETVTETVWVSPVPGSVMVTVAVSEAVPVTTKYPPGYTLITSTSEVDQVR